MDEKPTAAVIALQSGQDSAAEALYNAYQKDIYYYIFKTVQDPYLAEDLTQDTFMEILETIHKLKEPAAFPAWSRQIAYHRCIAYFHKRRELLADEDGEGYSIFDTVEEDRTELVPDEALDKADLRNTLQEMVNALPEDQRPAIMMRYFDELLVKEISQILGDLRSYPNNFDWVNATGVTTKELGGYRDTVLAMEAIDKWLAKPGFFAEFCGISEELVCDRQTFLSRFTVLENAFLAMTALPPTTWATKKPLSSGASAMKRATSCGSCWATTTPFPMNMSC